MRLLGGIPPTAALSTPSSAVMALCEQQLSNKLGDLSGELFLENLEHRPQKTLQAVVLVMLKVEAGSPVRNPAAYLAGMLRKPDKALRPAAGIWKIARTFQAELEAAAKARADRLSKEQASACAEGLAYLGQSQALTCNQPEDILPQLKKLRKNVFDKLSEKRWAWLKLAFGSESWLWLVGVACITKARASTESPIINPVPYLMKSANRAHRTLRVLRSRSQPQLLISRAMGGRVQGRRAEPKGIGRAPSRSPMVAISEVMEGRMGGAFAPHG